MLHRLVWEQHQAGYTSVVQSALSSLTCSLQLVMLDQSQAETEKHHSKQCILLSGAVRDTLLLLEDQHRQNEEELHPTGPQPGQHIGRIAQHIAWTCLLIIHDLSLILHNVLHKQLHISELYSNYIFILPPFCWSLSLPNIDTYILYIIDIYISIFYLFYWCSISLNVVLGMVLYVINKILNFN